MTLLMLILTSCGDDEKPSGELFFDFEVNAQDLTLGNTYEIGSANTLSRVDIAQFYVSNLTLIDSDGAEFAIGDHYLMKPDNNVIELGELTEGDYQTLRFNVGVDPSVNHNDPSELPEGDVLGNQSPSMNWSWQSGYRFVRIDGRIDSDGSGDVGDDDDAFEMHIGNDAYYRTVEIPYEFEAIAGDEINLSLVVDLGVLFDFDLAAQNVVHTGMVNDFNDGISSNIAAAFSR